MKNLIKDPTYQVLLGAVAIITLISFITTEYRNRAYLDEVLIEEFWNRKTHGLKKYDFVIIGDSRVYRGVDPQIISSLNPPLRGINLGYSSAGFSPILFQHAEKKLDPRGEKIILIGLTPHAFTQEAAGNAHLKQFLSKPLGEVVSSAYINGAFTVFAPLDWRKLLKRESSGDSNYIENYRTDAGFVGSDYRSREPLTALSSYREIYKKYKADPRIEEAFIRQIQEWKSLGFQVLVFDIPTHKSLADLEIQVSGHRFSWVRQQLNQLGIAVIRADSQDYVSYDGSHLALESAERFSEHLGIQLRQALQARLNPESR